MWILFEWIVKNVFVFYMCKKTDRYVRCLSSKKTINAADGYAFDIMAIIIQQQTTSNALLRAKRQSGSYHSTKSTCAHSIQQEPKPQDHCVNRKYVKNWHIFGTSNTQWKQNSWTCSFLFAYRYFTHSIMHFTVAFGANIICKQHNLKWP